jgi:hypothetical protein
MMTIDESEKVVSSAFILFSADFQHLPIAPRVCRS